MPGYEAATVEDYRKPCVQERIIFQQRYYEFLAVAVVAEYCCVGCETGVCSVWFICCFEWQFLDHLAFAEYGTFALAVAECGYLEVYRQGIDSLDSDTIQTY